MILSSSSWFSIWVGMELSSLTAPALMVALSSSLVSKIDSWKYYMVQCYSSSMFFLCMMCISSSSTFSSYSNFFWMVVILSMLFKMGILPFHGWFFHLAFSLPWKLFLVLSTIQKIGPLLIIGECSKNMSQLANLDLLISSIISLVSITGLKINSVRYFMVTSSVINTAWMIASTQVSKFSFISFMLLYFIHLLVLFTSFEKEFFNLFESSFNSSKNNFSMEMMKTLTIMSMIGIPPLVGFFMKISILEQLIFMNHYFTPIVLTMSSSVVMLMYMKMVISTISNMRASSLSQFKFNWILSTPLLFMSFILTYFI